MKSDLLKSIFVSSAMLFGLSAGAAIAADDYPSRDIRMVVPFAAGGGTDLIARIMAEDLGKRLGGTIFVDNIEGAGGSIGAGVVASEPADGYTLLMATPGGVTMAPHVTEGLSYDALTSFDYVAMLTDAPMMLAVPASSPYNSLEELIAAAKAAPGDLMFASSGVGGQQHLLIIHFGSLAGIDIVHVPYQGGSPAMLALVSGQVDAQIANYATIKGQLEAGERKVLATTTAERLSQFPDLPTINEIVPGFVVRNWIGALLPAGTDAAIVDKLDAAFAEALVDPEVLKRLADVGWEPLYMSQGAFRDAVVEEYTLNGEILEQAGLKIN